MKLFRCCDGTRDELVIEASSPRAAAEKYIETESWEDRSVTVRIDVYVVPVDDGSVAQWIPILLEPVAPRCRDLASHIWRELQMIVHDKGVYLRETCLRCGVYRITETGTQIPGCDNRPLKSVTYKDADEDSLANLNRTLGGKQADLFDRAQNSQEDSGEDHAPNSTMRT